MNIHEIEFQNPQFNEGIQNTVRNGDKWLKARLGDQIEFQYKGRLVRAYVVGVLYGQLDDIPASIFRSNHDPKCRTKAGITAELDQLYGAAPITGRLVTVLFFDFSYTRAEYSRALHGDNQ